MIDKNRVPPEPSLFSTGRLNRGGRPRKDGTRPDNAKTLADLGISKRRAALARKYASVEDDDAFEAALDKFVEQKGKGKRRRPLTEFLPLPDRRANSRHERETRANIARIISTARLIPKATEFDATAKAEMLRSLAQATIDLWSTGLVDREPIMPKCAAAAYLEPNSRRR
jgi:hypothetical protein